MPDELAFKFDLLAAAGVFVGQHPAQTDEGTHAGDVNLDRAFAAQGTGEHRHTLLGEHVRIVPSSAAAI